MFWNTNDQKIARNMNEMHPMVNGRYHVSVARRMNAPRKKMQYEENKRNRAVLNAGGTLDPKKGR